MYREDILLEAVSNNVSVNLLVIVYKVGNTIRGKVFNYRQALANLNVDYFLVHHDNSQCDCENFEVGQDLLRKLMQQGPNCREQPQILSQK